VSYIHSSTYCTSSVRFFNPNATSIINLSKRSTFNCRNDEGHDDRDDDDDDNDDDQKDRDDDDDDEMDKNDEDDNKDDYSDDDNIVDETVPKHNQ